MKLVALVVFALQYEALSLHMQQPGSDTSNASLAARQQHHHQHASKVFVEKTTQPTGRPMKNQSAAETTGVAQNGAGDLNAFVAALITNLVTMCIFFGVASVLINRYPLVYKKNTMTLKDVEELADDIEDCPDEVKPILDEAWEKKAPFQLGESYFAWWYASAEVTIDQVVEFRGLDQALLLEFANTAMKILAAIGVPLLFVLGPCHCFLGGYRAGAPGTEEADYLSYWGMANVVDGHPWLYWAHAFMMWYVIVIVQRLVYGAMRDFMIRRNKWLKELPTPRSTTILVEGIPEAYRHDEKLKQYFDEIFGKSVVKEAKMIKDTHQLLALVQTATAAASVIEQLKHKMKEETEDTEDNKQKLKELEEGLKAIQDEITQNRQELLKAAADEKDMPEPVVNLSKGFVTFECRRDAELAKMMVFTPNAEEFEVSIPPDPTDIIYTDLQKDPMAETVRLIIGYSLIAGVFWAYLPTVVSIAYFTSTETLREYSPAMEALAEDEAMAALWDGLVNSLALLLFVSFVPTFFVLIFKNFFVLKADAWLQHKIQDWYFYFQVIFILLVTAVGSSLLDTFQELAQNPLSIFSLLAETLPMATHFYLNFLPLQWVTHAQNLMRTAQLFKFKAFTVLFGKAMALKKSEPEDQDYYGLGSRSARFAFMLVLTLAFCSLSPLIVILGFVNFWTCRKVYGYLVVFCEIRKPDLGGVFYVSQLHHIQQGMFIYVVLMTGVLLERDLTLWPGLIAASGLIFMRMSYGRFKHIFRWESLSFQELKNLESPDLKYEVSLKLGHRPRIGSKVERSDLKYEQPELINKLRSL